MNRSFGKGNMSNILTFSDFYVTMLFVHELIIWCENIYPRVFVVTAAGSTFRLFRKWNIYWIGSSIMYLYYTSI